MDLENLEKLLAAVSRFNEMPQKHAALTLSPPAENGRINITMLDDYGDQLTVNFVFSTFRNGLEKMEKMLA
jgi:hypothetical protein